MAEQDDGPATAGDALGAAGELPAFEWRGKTYRVGRPTQRVRSRLEELIIQAETRAVTGMKGLIPDADYRAMLTDLARDNRKKEYRTGDGKLWREYMAGSQAETGFVLYLLALVRESHPEFSEDEMRAALADSGDTLIMAAERASGPFVEWLAEVLGLPPAAAGQMKAAIDAAFRQIGAGSGSTP